jgi:hypothetical protein
MFLLLISSSLTLSASAEEGQNPCMRASNSSSDVYYPGTNPFNTLHQRHDIIILIHRMQKGVKKWANYTS